MTVEFKENPVVNGRNSVINGRSSVINGRSSVINGRSSVINGRSSVINGRNSVINGRNFVLKSGFLSIVNSKTQLLRAYPETSFESEKDELQGSDEVFF